MTKFWFVYKCGWCKRTWGGWNTKPHPLPQGCPHCLAPWAKYAHDGNGVRAIG